MRRAYVGGSLTEPNSTGQRANCHECNGELYSRRLSGTDNEYTWVHFNAMSCSLSCDRDYPQFVPSRATQFDRTRRSASDSERVTVEVINGTSGESERRPTLNENEILKSLKQEVRATGCLDKARECLLQAIKFKQQSSIPGILAGLKKHLIRLNTATETQLKELDSMTTKVFYLAQHKANH